jgi:hypothetical protein
MLTKRRFASPKYNDVAEPRKKSKNSTCLFFCAFKSAEDMSPFTESNPGIVTLWDAMFRNSCILREHSFLIDNMAVATEYFLSPDRFKRCDTTLCECMSNMHSETELDDFRYKKITEGMFVLQGLDRSLCYVTAKWFCSTMLIDWDLFESLIVKQVINSTLLASDLAMFIVQYVTTPRENGLEYRS